MRQICTPLLAAFVVALCAPAAHGQISFAAQPVLSDRSFAAGSLVNGLSWPSPEENDGAGHAAPEPPQPAQDESGGLVSRSVKRGLQDQKQLYLAPFKASNFKWDALVLGGTALFLATDRHIENNLPGGHFHLYQNTSDIAIGGLAGALAGVWLYGIKTEHHHARETGELELEALADTFLIYAPMQLIAGRQRPGEGNGHGDFLKHHALNTSFPGGHAMFTWTMATVLSHDYSQKWVQVAAYGSAFTVTLTRFLARDHWASDMWVGTALGIGIGAHVFHAHCDPELSPKCRQHHGKILPLLHLRGSSFDRLQQ
ncbi:MAG: phosphatase PAP2 family protein [Acidobacteria bacterium]|nr:phosphatase PAP2 family protein [Acidobacteriota bacterium]